MPGLRIGLSQRVEDLPDRDERRDALDQRWTTLLEGAGHLPLPIPNLVVDVAAYVDALAVDLLVLTGGNDLASLPGATAAAPERDRTEAALVDLAVQRRLPLLGVCRGLQHLVVHLGGRLEPITGHTATEHAITAPGGPLPIEDGRVVNSFHDWAIPADGVPAGLSVLATASDGTVEAVAHDDLPIVGVMWHPERPGGTAADLALVDALAARARETEVR